MNPFQKRTRVSQTPPDTMPLLFDMNGKLSAMQAQMGAIQIQLATDKAEHKTVHDELNKKLEEHASKLDAIELESAATKARLKLAMGTGTALLGLIGLFADKLSGLLFG